MNYENPKNEQIQLLANSKVFGYAKSNRVKESRCVYVAIPITAYKYAVKTQDIDGDFLKTAIIRMKQYYEKQGQSNCINEIADALGLHTPKHNGAEVKRYTPLVKDIIREYENNQQNLDEIESSEESKDQNTQTTTTRYYTVFYNRITQSYINSPLKTKKYEELRDAYDGNSQYQPSIGESNCYTLRRLNLPKGANPAPLNPANTDISPILRRTVKSSQNIDMTYTGFSEDVYLVTALYYDKNNMNKWVAEYPFAYGRASWIVNTVETYVNSSFPYAETLKAKLHEMKESVDRNQMPRINSQSTNLEYLCYKALESVFGEQNFNTFAKLRGRLCESVCAYAKLVRYGEKSSEENFSAEIHQELRGKYYVAVYNVISEMFAHVLTNSDIAEHQAACLDYIAEMKDGSDGLYHYRELMKNIGFDKPDISKHVVLHKKTLAYLMEEQDMQFIQRDDAKLDSLIFLCALQANYNPNHPLREVSTYYPDFCEQMQELVPLKNKAKHENAGEIMWSRYDFHQLILKLFGIMVLKPKESLEPLLTCSFLDNMQFEELEQNNRDVEKIKKEFPSLFHNSDLCCRAEKTVRAFRMKDSEYYSCAVNLLDEALKLLLISLNDHSNGVNTSLRNSICSDGDNKDDIVAKAEEVLGQYNLLYKFSGRYKVENFKEAKYIATLTLGNKMLYLVFFANQKAPNYFRDLLDENGDLFRLIERITDDRGRGHRQKADFARKDEMKVLHREVMHLCNSLAKDIEQMEMEERG